MWFGVVMWQRLFIGGAKYSCMFQGSMHGVSPGDHRTSLRRLSRTLSAHSVVVGVFGVVGVVGQLGRRMAVISVCAVVVSLLNVCFMFICEAYVCSLHVPCEILASFCPVRANQLGWLSAQVRRCWMTCGASSCSMRANQFC